MEKVVVVIEVADQQGKILDRFRATKFPVRIGRAYDNDLIIADPYICPHHCEVVLGESGEIVVNDLASINGTFAVGNETRSDQLAAAADSPLRIGHSILHFRFPDQPLGATRIDEAVHTVRNWPPRSLHMNIAVLMLGTLVMTLWEYMSSYTEFVYSRYFFGQQIPAMIAVAGWAAVWSMVSRITTHRFAFLRHATILVTIILAMALSDYLLGFLKFGFAAYWPFEAINIALVAVAIALLLYWHLRLCSEQKRSRLLIAASVCSAAIVGLAQVNEYLDRQEFRGAPVYSTILKPPAFQMVKSRTVEDFLNNSETLKKKIAVELDALQTARTSQVSADSRPE